MTNSDTGHGGQDLEQLRADLETVVAERNRALSELAELKAKLTAQDIVTGATAPQAQQVQEPAMTRASRTWGVASVFKGGILGAALLAGVEWLRRHREVTVALVVAGVAAVAAWLMWPDPGNRPSFKPPVTPTVTITQTSVPPLTTPPTAVPTPSVEPTITTMPTTTPRSPTTGPASPPAARGTTTTAERERTSTTVSVQPTASREPSGSPTRSPSDDDDDEQERTCAKLVLPPSRSVELCITPSLVTRTTIILRPEARTAP